MSSLWKRITNANRPDQQHQKSIYGDTVMSAKEGDSMLISSIDEKPYLTVPDAKTADPLLAKSQIIKDFELLLKESTAFPHFLEYLQSCEADHFADFWIECDKFRALALSLLTKYRESENKSPQNLPCTLANHCRSLKRRNSRNIPLNQNPEDEKNSSFILPDLVSNIPNDVAVTPISSPEEPSSFINTGNPRSFMNTKDTRNDISDALGRSGEEDNIQSKNDFNGNLDKPPEREANSNQSLTERLLGFASQIYDKYIDISGPKSVELPEKIRDIILDKILKYEVNCNIFTPAQEFVCTFLEREYFSKYLESEYFLKQIVEVFTSQKVLLQDILLCDSAMPYFMEYLEQEGGQSLLEFWISAFNFKQHLQKQQQGDSYNAEEAQADAMILYDKYFSLQATHKLGFSDQVRFLVECNICQEKGPSSQCFDVPLRVVLSVIQREFLTGYISSTLHIKFVSELVNTMRISTLGRKKRSGSGSTSFSEESSSTNRSSGRARSGISQTNTLLAFDSSCKSAPGAMRIDATQILDPDSLWRRKNFTKLSCGFVDELGRFESDLQPDPERRNESRLSKTLRRFVKVEENKVKEDMAYKVAEMIIKDVTNVTLGGRREFRARSSSSRPLSCTEEQLGRPTPHPLPSGQLQRSSSAFISIVPFHS